MNEWADAYQSGFAITTHKPSRIACNLLSVITAGSSLIDLGCGQGRNSIFFADNGHYVDAVDIVDLMQDQLNGLPMDVRRRIRFVHDSVLNLVKFVDRQYDGALAARLIQYLNADQLQTLFTLLNQCLVDKGYFGCSFTVTGGIRMRPEYHVSTFSHAPDLVQAVLERTGFAVRSCQQGSQSTQFVPYSGTIESYDVLAQKVA